MKQKQKLSILFSICLGNPGLGHTKKRNYMKRQTVDQEICLILVI